MAITQWSTRHVREENEPIRLNASHIQIDGNRAKPTIAARAANVVEDEADWRVRIAALHREIKIAPLQKLPHLRLGKAGYRRSC